MPQKQNPVGPSALVALNIQMAGLRASLQAAAAHQHQRDGASWFAEWMVLPQVVLTNACALHHALKLAEGVNPLPARMHAALEDGLGLIHAEALSFALASQMPRPEAQAATKALCKDAMDTQTPLPELAARAYPELPKGLFDAASQMGTAADDARTFARRARSAAAV